MGNYGNKAAKLSSPIQPKIEEDDLSSEGGVDYTRLRDFLNNGEWKQADKETVRLMLKVANRERQSYFNESINNLPCTDLRTIDQLWVKYSNGRFGFSVQKRVWLECGGKIDGGKIDEKRVRVFGDAVGWYENNSWLLYNEITFSLAAPFGHLPSWLLASQLGCGHFSYHYIIFGGVVSWLEMELFSRVQTCKM